MPNRIVREGILTSERIEQLDAAAEVFYRRLMSKVDDHGLYDARPSILRTSLFPLRVDRVREADISRWIAACEKAGLIALYQHAGKPYLHMLDTRWQARSEAKYPLPPAGGEGQPQTPASNCAQVPAAAHVFVDVVVDESVVEEGGTALALVPAPPPAWTGSNEAEIPPKAVVPLSKAWELPLSWGEDAERLGWKVAQVIRESEKFRQYWVSGKGAGTRRGLKGWRQSWSTWLSKAERFAA